VVCGDLAGFGGSPFGCHSEPACDRQAKRRISLWCGPKEREILRRSAPQNDTLKEFFSKRVMENSQYRHQNLTSGTSPFPPFGSSANDFQQSVSSPQARDFPENTDVGAWRLRLVPICCQHIRNASSIGFACTLPARSRGLAPTLQGRPKLGQRAEFRTLAKEDVDLFFQGVRVVSRRAHVFHVFP
jgi:hypothetical protein